MIKNIVIKGERCSGTNYVQQLVLVNTVFEKCGHHLTVQPSAGLENVWKHGFYNETHVPFNNSETLFLVIHRNLYDWLRSLYLIPWHLPMRNSFHEFVTQPVCCDTCEYFFYELPEYINGQRYCGNVIHLRYLKLRDWMKNLRNYHLIDYDALIRKPDMIVDILQQHGVTTNTDFVNWSNYKDSTEPYNRKEYFALTDEDMLYINVNMDNELEKMLTHSND
jgi:hypothetical protein